MKEHRIVCIGMGFLMEKLSPCYQGLLGERLAGSMIATTEDEADIERKRAVFPFEVQLGNNLEALRKMQPTLILFAPPPKAVYKIVEQELVPYFAECRANMQQIPIICAFPPAPRGGYYLEKLGSDVLVCNALPNVILEIGGKKLVNEGITCITFPENGTWPTDRREFILSFFNAIGNSLELKDAHVMTVLPAGANIINLALVIRTITDGLTAANIDVSFGQVASAMRHSLREHTGYDQGGDLPEKTVVEAWLYDIFKPLILNYYQGLLDYSVSKGMPVNTISDFLKAYADLYLHYYSVEPQETVERLVSGQATKGGVAEKGDTVYQEKLKDKIFEAFSHIKEKTIDSEFFENVRAYAIECSEIAGEHGKRLAGGGSKA